MARRIPIAEDLDAVRNGVDYHNIPMDSIYWPMREAFLAGEEFDFDDNNQPVPVENDIFSDEAEQERCEAIGEPGPLDEKESTFEEQKENNDFAHDDDPQDINHEFDL